MLAYLFLLLAVAVRFMPHPWMFTPVAAAVLWLGAKLRANAKPLPVIGAALASSVSFFLISNFAVWAAYDMYPKNFSGLLTSYTLALPFFRNAVEGDLLFTSVMFATPVVLGALSEAFGKGDHPAAA